MNNLPFNTNNLKPVAKNKLSLFEIENNGEYHIYHVAQSKNYIVVGSACNVGLLPDFWIEKDSCFSMNQHLQAIYEMINESLINNDELKGEVLI